MHRIWKSIQKTVKMLKISWENSCNTAHRDTLQEAFFAWSNHHLDNAEENVMNHSQTQQESLTPSYLHAMLCRGINKSFILLGIITFYLLLHLLQRKNKRKDKFIKMHSKE